MTTLIDFTKLKRVPTSKDIDTAQAQLEIALKEIIQKHTEYFSSNNISGKIEYFISHSLTTDFIKLPF